MWGFEQLSRGAAASITCLKSKPGGGGGGGRVEI